MPRRHIPAWGYWIPCVQFVQRVRGRSSGSTGPLTQVQNGMNPSDGNTAVRISQKELQALHEKRMRKVLDIAWKNGNEVVILGAFGCGAFSNPPLAVAHAMKAVVQEYRMKFETIEFAVYCSPRDDSNFRVFQNVLGSL